nr:L,D-transpeptidase [Amycolatopsis taiwanensis]
MKKILAAVGGLATAVVLAACSSPATDNAAIQPAAAASSVEQTSSAAPTTTTPPVSTSSSTPPPATSTKSSSSTSKTTPKSKPTTAAPGVPCSISSGACVSLSAKKAWLVQDGKVIYGPVPALGGRKGNATPTGMFRVLSKEKMHLSREFDNAPMPNSVFFYPGDAFHTGSLSTPSHGCIHLSSTASLKFFNTLQIGQAVQILP